MISNVGLEDFSPVAKMENGHRETYSSTQIATLRSLASSINTSIDALSIAQDAEEQSVASANLTRLAQQLRTASASPADAFVDFTFQPLANACVRIALATGLFDHLPVSHDAVGVSINDLSRLTGTEPDLTARIIRGLVAFDVIQQDATTRLCKHTPQSQLYTEPGQRAWAIWLWDVMIAGANAGLGPYFEGAARPIANPSGAGKTPFGVAHGAEHESLFEIVGKIGKQSLMKEAMSGSSAQCAREAVLSFDFAGLRPGQDDVVLVDVGGAKGATIAELRQAGVKGKMVLQDLPAVLDGGVLPSLDADVMPYNFFKQEQPVKGASAYLYQRIFHDWGDEDCGRIIDSLRPAMRKDSKLLICDVVVQDVHPHPRKVLRDMNMLLVGGKERTQEEWRTILHKGGFRVEAFHGLHNSNNSIVEARLL